MKPAQYWRESKQIKKYLGKSGVVVASTIIRASSPEFNYLVPYSYLMVEFNVEKKEMMGVGNEIFKVGDKVVTVMRKMSKSDNKNLIEYGLKVTKVLETK